MTLYTSQYRRGEVRIRLLKTDTSQYRLGANIYIHIYNSVALDLKATADATTPISTDVEEAVYEY